MLRGIDEPYIGQFIPSKIVVGKCNVSYWLKPDGTKGTIEILADDGGGVRTLPLAAKYAGSGGGMVDVLL